MTDKTQTNEGEGNRTAARQYNQAGRDFIKSGRVQEAAKDAENALDGPDAAELRRAEAEGKRHSHGEDPAISGKTK